MSDELNEHNRREFLIFSFLDSATYIIPKADLDKRLNRMIAQFFYLGVIDFLRQAEDLDENEFLSLIEKVFVRYHIPLNLPIGEYVETAAKNIDDVPSLQMAMKQGAEAFRRFWANKDTQAPLALASLLTAVDDLNEEYEKLGE